MERIVGRDWQTPRSCNYRNQNPSAEKTDEAKTTTTDPGTNAPIVVNTGKGENSTNPKNAIKQTSVPGRKIEKKEPQDNYTAYEEPKSSNPSNIDKNTIVTPIETGKTVEGQTVATVNTGIVDSPVDIEKKMDENDIPKATFAVNTNNELEVLNTSIKKNSSRGFFRKVGRVVGKVTNIGPKADKETDDNSKGVRIANFEIALK